MKISQILNPGSVKYLAGFTEAVIDAARIRPGERVKEALPANTSGHTLIRPGGRTCYPAVWTQDFSHTLASGFVTSEEIKNHLYFIARAQNGPKERRLETGAVIPPFAVPDHVLFNGESVFYPGTYSSGTDQGGERWGMIPPVCNQYDIILIAYHLWRSTGDSHFLRHRIAGYPIIERLRLAFQVPRIDTRNSLIFTDDKFRAVGFIYCDSIYMTGHLLFASLLRWRAGRQLAALERTLGNHRRAKAWQKAVADIPKHLPTTFRDSSQIGGWLMAATTIGRQPDVWGTIYALFLRLLGGKTEDAALAEILRALEEGTICYQGALRHVPTNHDASPTSAWDRTHTPHNHYQNGAYWHVPTGWLIAVLARQNQKWAKRIFNDMIAHFKKGDFRKGTDFDTPLECFGKNGRFKSNPLFAGSVAVPYGVIKVDGRKF